MNLTPIRNRILIQPLEEDTKTSSGLYIPTASEDTPARGRVVRVGQGALSKDGTTIPMLVKEGDTVVYPREVGQKVKVEDQEYVILVEDQVLAISE